jgi:hypothetical protein
MNMPDGGTSSNNTSNTTTDMSSSSMFFSTQLPFNLLFSGWVVSTSGQLAGAWFACFFLAISFQVLQAVSSRLEARWQRKLSKQLGQQAGKSKKGVDDGGLEAGGDGEGVCCSTEDDIQNNSGPYKWWMAFSRIDIARAVLRFIMVCVAYLMMLAVMSFNVAIFFAITSGIFAGTLFQGRRGYSSSMFCDVNMAAYGGAAYTAPASSCSTVSVLPEPNRTTARLALLVRAASITFLVLVLVWVMNVEGGLGWVDASLFGWHAFLFTLAVPVLMSEAVLAFSAPIFDMVPLFRSRNRQLAAVVLHASLNVLSLICVPLALSAIVYYKKLSAQPIAYPFFTLYSSHSWMGVTTLVIWGSQFGLGIYKRFVTSGSKRRQFVSTLHSFLGKVTYVAGLATCATGLEDMQSSDLSGVSYGAHSTFSLMAAAGSIVLIFLGMAVFAVLEVKRSAELVETTLPKESRVNHTEKDLDI